MSTNAQNTSNTGWEQVGKVIDWVYGKLSPIDFLAYTYIVKMTVGYNQYTSTNLDYKGIAKASGISLRSISTVIPRLIADGYITKVPTNQIAYTGKISYKYRLNMKLPDFPGLYGLKKHRADEKPVTLVAIHKLDGTGVERIWKSDDRAYLDFCKRHPKYPTFTPTDEQVAEYNQSKLTT